MTVFKVMKQLKKNVCDPEKRPQTQERMATIALCDVSLCP
tara:strand:+ start:2174 stop:2293 length:120 start_codon:yes stop_codon:yes gene_type:complete